jgi:hypothetical protein
MALFYSEGMRRFLKNHIKNVNQNNNNAPPTHFVRMMKQMLSSTNVRDINDAFFHKETPETFLDNLYDHWPETFYFDSSMVSGHWGEYYFVRMFDKLGLNDKVLYLNHYDTDDALYVSVMNNKPDIDIIKIADGELAYKMDYDFDEHRRKIRNPSMLVVSNLNNDIRTDPKYKTKLKFDDKIEYNGSVYKVDSVLLSNFNIDQCNMAHQIAGITCKKKRYMYNGWIRGTQDETINQQDLQFLTATPCELMPYDWFHASEDFCLNKAQCKLSNISASDQNMYTKMCFNMMKGSRTYIYVKQTVNTTTNNNIAPPTPAHECAPGKILNPASGRCVSMNSVLGRRLVQQQANNNNNNNVHPARECAPGKILNPASGRCVSRNSVLGRRLVQQQANNNNNNNRPTKECDEHKVLNPRSNRCVSKRGTLGKILTPGNDKPLKDCEDNTKVFNKKSGRCVKEHGITGRLITFLSNNQRR